jgi:hypothetical protein
MRARRLITALAVTASIFATTAGCAEAKQQAKQTGYDALQVQLQQTLTAARLTNVVVVVEQETDKTKVKGNPPAPTAKTGSKPKPSSSAGAPGKQTKAATPQPKTSTVTYDILSATFDIPGLKCRGNVEQPLTLPVGLPYFDEVIFPDGTEVEVDKAARSAMTGETIFDYVFNKYPKCRQEGVTALPTPTTPPTHVPHSPPAGSLLVEVVHSDPS